MMFAPVMGRAYAKTDNLGALLRLAAPIGVSQLAQTSMGFVDAVMVGRLGATELAGVALGSSIFIPIVVVGLGVVLAVGPTVAQADGAADRAGVTRFARQGLWLSALLTPLVFALLSIASYNLERLGQEPAVARIAGEYLRVVAWGSFPFLAFGALRSWIESVGRPLPVTLIAVSGVGVNVAANYGFVYGGFGVPEIGAVGAAYATVVSYVYLLAAIAALALAREEFRQYGVLTQWRGPDWPVLGELARIGLPIGGSFGLETGLFTAATILMGSFGAVALAAHQIALQLAALAFMVPLSIALASTIRVGNCVGAGYPDAARHAGWLTIGLGGVSMALSASVFLLVPGALIQLFLGEADGGEDVAVTALATRLLFLAGAFQIVDGLQGSAAGALRGLKDTFGPMVIGAIGYWGVGLTGAWWLSRRLGPEGVWWGLVAGLAVAAVLLIGRWANRARRLA